MSRRHLTALLAALAACGTPTPPPAGSPPVVTPPPPAAEDAGAALFDDARVVSFQVPPALACGEATTGEVVVENTGTTTWTRGAAYRLGGVDDTDPFKPEDARLELPGDGPVAPGQQVRFVLPLRAPATEGDYRTDWRMLQEHVRWFGDTAAATITVSCPRPAARAGKVRLDGHTLRDDDGPFQALGASLFWAAWAYRHDRPRLEAALALLQQNGFHYIRALGVVGDPQRPDCWDGREIDRTWPDYDAVIAGVTDLAYQQYGLRVQWTLIGDGQVSVPTSADRYALVDRFLAMSRGREHQIILFELANEAWQNGFPGDAGREELRDLTRYLNARTDVLVAASAPDGHDCAAAQALYAGGIADVATIHFDRDVWKTKGPWRPVRQPWEHEYCQLPVGNNNEPIGPGASVASEDDPVRLNAAAIATYVSNLPFYVFHTRAGVRGDEALADMPGLGAFTALSQVVPADLAAWTRKNAHWADSPFRVYAGDESGALHPDTMWPDFGGSATSGVVRAYGGVHGDGRFFVFPFGIRNRVTLEPRRDVEFDVVHPMTGEVLSRQTRAAGERFELTGGEAFVLRGRFR